jgi:hypothetical protein
MSNVDNLDVGPLNDQDLRSANQNFIQIMEWSRKVKDAIDLLSASLPQTVVIPNLDLLPLPRPASREVNQGFIRVDEWARRTGDVIGTL